MYTAGNKQQLFLPILCTFLGDTPEAQRAACMLIGGAVLQRACWTCEVSGHDLNLCRDYEQRNFEELKLKIQKWTKALIKNDKITQTKQEAKQESMYINEVK